MEPKTTKKPSRKLVVFKRELPFYLMLIPGVTFLIIFSYLPMFGLVMAFQDFTPLRSFKNSPWVGLKNFRDMLALPTFWNVVGNTLSISIAKIILRLLVPLILALLLNEVVHHKFMRMAQTVFFLPYFLSWAVMGGVLRNLFQYDGMVNELLGRIGIDPIMFLGSNTWFPIIIILSDVWKDMGYNMIIFLAAITGVDPALNESAALDGANRWQQIWHITLPTIRPIVVMLLVLSLGSVLSAGMEQIMLLYNPMVYKSSDIIDTLVYRLGLRVNVVSQLFAAGFWGGAVLGKAAKAAGHGADFIPYLEFGAAGTQLDHGTGELMSQLVGVAHKVQVAVPEIQFPVAQAAAGNLHHYFARPRFFLYFVDLKAMRLHQKCAFELHCFPHFLFCCVISFFNL